MSHIEARRDALWYNMFRVYVYFCNLLISRVIINTLLCNPDSMIVKSLNRRSHGCRHIAEPCKIFFIFLYSDVIIIGAQITTGVLEMIPYLRAFRCSYVENVIYDFFHFPIDLSSHEAKLHFVTA